MPVTQEEINEFNQRPVNQNYDLLDSTYNTEIEDEIYEGPTSTYDAGKEDEIYKETPTVFDGTATLEDAGATYDGMQSAEGGFGEEVNYTPKQENTVQKIFSKVGQTVEGALTELGKIPGAIVDTTKKTVDVFGKKLDVGKTIASALINKAAGAPISLLFSLLPDDGIHQSTKAARDTGLLTGDTTVTQDKYGINTQTSFDPAKSAENYLDYNVKQVEKLETALAKTRAKYATEQEYLDMTTRMRQELADRQKYVDYQTGVGSTYDTADPNIAVLLQ
jgi:hypothetical protein